MTLNKITYLSIDLDYWNNKKLSKMTNFLTHVLRLGKPIKIVRSHEQLLRDLNKTRYDLLINIDYHADIAEDDKNGNPIPLNDGTWANRVVWRKNGTYEWRHPFKRPSHYNGYCHVYKNPFTDHTSTSWKNVLARQGIKNINWKNIEAVGIALSPDWTKPVGRIEVAESILK